ncbi:MAG: hypothetical protein RLZZ450_2151 [Pseudomonadota bacterium]|jgi:hypothetical protein
MSLIFSFFEYTVFVFSRHLNLLLVLLIVGAIVFARFGRAFGIDRLFWHESARLQLRAGIATALLFAKVGFVGYLLDEGKLHALPAFVGTLPTERALAAALYLILLTLPVGLLWGLLGIVARSKRGAEPATPRRYFVLGAFVGLLGSIALLVLFARLVPHTPTLPGWLISLLQLGDAAPAVRPLHVLASVFVLALSAEYLIYAFTRESFTPALAICTLLGLYAGVTGFLEFRAYNPSAIVLAVLAVVALGGMPRYKVRLWALRARYTSPVALQDYPDAAQPCAYALVRSEHIPWQKAGAKRPLVLVCASGGGLRAALWTTEVLSELELALPNFADSVRLIAGASGGMVGASAYTLTLLPFAERSGTWAHDVSRAELYDRLARDSLSATIKRLVFRDLPFVGLPIANLKSRGEALERCWRQNLGPSFVTNFGALAERERRGELPSLVFSPMLVEDGRRLLISNLDLGFLAQNQVAIDGLAVPLSRSSFELARLFPNEFADFPVSAAARLSAAFPYVSPAVSLPTLPRRRVVDAGYYDNYGMSVCAAWLADCFCTPERRRWIEQNVSRILIVQLRDQVSPLQGAGGVPQAPTGLLSRALEGLSSPVEGVFSSRDAVSIFRNDEQLEQVIRLYDAGFEPGFVRTEIFAYPGEASLSWYLSKYERETISLSAQKLGTQLDDLRAFWKGRSSQVGLQVGVHIAQGDQLHWGER